ncbi:hypothetical protein [Dactylosporangium sp. CA-233914]|uniref:hypothetical protein n=1 Tax=Dactylosporangium sp. CA-233914 TaxID=3239934 RepID=UPI003D8BD02D
MTDLESRIAATLAERAERTAPAAELGERAARRARGIRRRRRIIGTAAACVIAAAAFALLPPQPPPAPATTLPAETAAPPGGIGSDRGLLHFDVDLPALPAAVNARIAMTQWVSGDGYETFAGMDADRQPVLIVLLGTDPGTVEEWRVAHDAGQTRAVRWRQGDVWGVSVVRWEDRDLLPLVARAVRLERVQRCAMPLHLSELPPGARWSECQTVIRRGPGPSVFVYAGLTIHRADDKVIYIWADADASSSFAPDRTVAGRPARWRSGTGQFANGLWIGDFGGVELYVTDFETGPADWFTPQEAAWYTARLSPGGDLDAPSSWPRRAVS